MESTVQPAVLPRHDTKPLPAAAALVALGIVYGDIGTSPLYAFKQAAQAAGTLSPDTILGVASLILWTVILIVSLKYAILLISIAVLVGLFMVQRKGTAFIGNIFGPLMMLWFLAIAVLGMRGIIATP